MDDADAHGFVSNFARPGGNITGMSFPSGELSTKWLEFLIEILSPGARFAALWDTSGTANQVQLTEQAARTVGAKASITTYTRLGLLLVPLTLLGALATLHLIPLTNL